MLVLITGASTGIGRASAKRFVSEGDEVIAVARSQERLQTLADEVGGPPRLTPIVADVTDAASMDAMVARVLAGRGVPDVVVANAGVGLDALLAETSDEALKTVFEVNVFGVVRTVRPFLPGMIGRGRGRILLISSIVGKRGIPHYSAYSASKFAIQGMAESVRTELRGTGVTVGVVCPASTETEFDARKLRAGPSQKSARPGRHSAESVARAIVRMSRSRRREIVLTPEGKTLSWASFLVPGLVDRLLARMLVDREGVES